MQKFEASWRQNSDWKARYSKLYSSRRISLPQAEKRCRISFMANEYTPYQSLLMRSHLESLSSSIASLGYSQSILSHRSDPYRSNLNHVWSDSLGGNETVLLDMVREQSKDLREEAQDKTLNLQDDGESDDQTSEPCVHGLSMRFTERSVSRSRFSRISTKRDMDIPSILAFNTQTTAPIPLEIPGFENKKVVHKETIPRWSIRRSICPVCSQKWRDRSTVSNIKYSGLKKNSLTDLPKVMAPARLRASITKSYVPRPALAVIDENVPGCRLLRNSSATWQLTRARKFHFPKPQLPPPDATAPPSAPLARKDLDMRVNKFFREK